MTDDIAALFDAADVHDVAYQELAREQRRRAATERWPMLAAVAAELRARPTHAAPRPLQGAAELFGRATEDLS